MVATLEEPCKPLRRGVSRLRQGAIFALCIAALAACGERDQQRVLFDGVYFRTKAKAVDKADRQSFVVNVPKVQRSFNGAREAGRFEGTRYCLSNYGTSEILWSIGPDTADGRLVVENNDFNFRGRCVLW
ncbi:MAG: hypothetical protein AAGF50_12840 [Pseudomonadota bacterium]